MKQGLREISDGTVREIKQIPVQVSDHSTLPPCELLMGRRLRSQLDLLQPSLTNNVEHSQAKQKLHHDTNKPYRQFGGELVYAKDFTSAAEKWIPVVVEKVTHTSSN